MPSTSGGEDPALHPPQVAGSRLIVAGLGAWLALMAVAVMLVVVGGGGGSPILVERVTPFAGPRPADGPLHHDHQRFR